MDPVEYVFRIDAFQPETLPMARLAEYMAALAKMFGHAEHTHFVGIEPGSAKLRTAVDAVDAPKVEARLNGVRIGEAPKDALAGKLALEELLANDNALASLTDSQTGRVIVPFVGRDRAKPLAFPPFREDTFIDGVLVKIGGKDPSAHATLQDGNVFHVGVTMRRDLAKELAPLLYGPPLRMFGNGRFERLPDGLWKMSDFRVERYEHLDPQAVPALLSSMRAIAGNGLMGASSVEDLASIRDLDQEDEAE